LLLISSPFWENAYNVSTINLRPNVLGYLWQIGFAQLLDGMISSH
jgi:hypothetical protein